MIGTTLTDIRQHIETLATDDGEFYLVCACDGDIPVPASGLRFPDRPTASAAARATEQYRSALRRYDPAVPVYDIVVCQDAGTTRPTAHQDHPTARQDHSPAATAGLVDSPFEPATGGSTASRSDLVECCHRVAGAVFETLSANGHTAVESAVMDAYFELAERLSTPDGLCLCLLESMASEIDERLTPAEQSRLLRAAAARLPSQGSTSHPIYGSLVLLEANGLLEGYRYVPDDTAPAVVHLSAYALAPQHGRLPVLPLAVECYRHQPGFSPASITAVDAEDGWELTIEQTADTDPSGLVSAPIVEA